MPISNATLASMVHMKLLKFCGGNFPSFTACSAQLTLLKQGLTLHGGVVVDLRRAGGLGDDDWWLAIYVMLSRARRLTNLILVGFTEQVEDLLRRGPPTRLIWVTELLERRAQITEFKLKDW